MSPQTAAAADTLISIGTTGASALTRRQNQVFTNMNGRQTFNHCSNIKPDKAAYNSPVSKRIETVTGQMVKKPEGFRSQKIKGLANDLSEWLGKESKLIYNDAYDPIFLSKDHTRRFRYDFHRPTPHENPHVHLDQVINGKWIKSGQIYPVDVPHK
jgi:hypothetical protein